MVLDKVDEILEPIKDFDEQIEPGELLDDRWFFGNLLHCNDSRMFRSFSDPCTSWDHCSREIFGDKSYEETYESIKKLSGNDESRRFNLVKAPSLPASMKEGISEGSAAKGGADPTGRSKSSRKILSKNVISRAPSLPTSLRSEDFPQDEEVEFSMGKLIRQASMKNSDTRAHGVPPNSGIKRHQTRKKPDVERIKMEGLEEMRTPITNQLRKQKSSSVVESKKLQDFGFDVKKKDTLNPYRISLTPDLREKQPLHLSEARRTQSSAPPFPKWGGNKSTEAMKEQIKFWARAVASNVHQEC